MTSGDPVSVTLDRQREWDEAIRLHFYNQENELFLHGGWSLLPWQSFSYPAFSFFPHLSI